MQENMSYDMENDSQQNHRKSVDLSSDFKLEVQKLVTDILGKK